MERDKTENETKLIKKQIKKDKILAQMDKCDLDWEKYRRIQNGGFNLMLKLHSPQY